MNCQRIADDELVERYLNGQLDPAVQDDLEVHILGCPECLARAEALSAIRANLAPRDGQAALQANTDRRWQAAWMGVAAAALIAISVAGFYLLRSKNPKPAQVTSTQPQPSQVAPTPAPTAQKTGSETQAPVRVGEPQQKPTVVAHHATNPRSIRQSSGGVAAAGAVQRENPASQQTNSQQTVAAQHNVPEAPASTFDLARHKSSLMEMSQGTSVELYALAAVQPPPYTSDGSETGNSSNGVDSSGLASGLLPGGRTLFQDAMVAYREKRYPDAAKLLENVVGATPEAVAPNFYLGICRLIEERRAEAIEPLKTAAAAPAGPLTQPAHFYLAKAYLRVGDMAKAESEMQIAASLPGRLTTQARSIAERIHALRSADASQEKGSSEVPPRK